MCYEDLILNFLGMNKSGSYILQRGLGAKKPRHGSWQKFSKEAIPKKCAPMQYEHCCMYLPVPGACFSHLHIIVGSGVVRTFFTCRKERAVGRKHTIQVSRSGGLNLRMNYYLYCYFCILLSPFPATTLILFVPQLNSVTNNC